MDRKPSRKKVIESLLGNDFSKIKRDENHPLMRFIDDPVTLDELIAKPEQSLWDRLEKGSVIYNYVLILNLLNFVEELNPDSSEIKTIRRKIVKCKSKDEHQEFYRTLEELRIAMAFKSRSWPYEFEPKVGDGDFDLVVRSDGKRVYLEVYFPDISDVHILEDKIDKKLSDFNETDGYAIFLINVGALDNSEEYIENAMESVDKTSELSGIIFYSYDIDTMIDQRPTNKNFIHKYWFKSPINIIFKKTLDTVGGFGYKFYDYPKYDFSHARSSTTERLL